MNSTHNELEAEAAPVDYTPAFSPLLIRAGLVLVGFFLISIVAWSALAPVESAVVARGIVSVSSFRKQIQHFEGGIVEKIHVADGDRVTRGQLLVSLSPVEPAARLRKLEIQELEAQAIIARLQAQLEGREELAFGELITNQLEDSAVASIVRGQKNIFASERKLSRDQHSVLNHKKYQAAAELKGLQGKMQATQRQRDLLVEELQGFEIAFEKQVISKRMLLQVQQQLAELDGNISELKADIGRLRQSILEVGLQKSEALAERNNRLNNKLREQRTSLFELGQQRITTQDILRRTDVVSPIDGVVVNLQIHTREGVIAPGQALMDILPTNDKLIIDAYIRPDDIDEVRPGMPADVRLTSISRRSRRPLEGTVTNISADRLVDPGSGQEYYRARVELTPLVAESQASQLLAGMGAEVFIKTGARSPIEYLFEPISNSLQRGLRER